MALSEAESALIEAAKNGDTDLILRLALSHKINIDILDEEYACTPLMWAAINGKSVAALLLIKLGANIKKKSKQNRTVLHYAAKSGLLDVCQSLVFLVYHQTRVLIRLKIDHVDEEGNSCLHLAAREGHLEIVRCLVNTGAMKNTFNAKKQTACDIAQSNGHDEVVAFLLSQEAVVSLRYNPLHVAAAKNQKLPDDVSAGAFNEVDLFGCNPFEYACWYGRRDFSDFMRISVLPSRPVSAIFGLNSLGFACYRGDVKLAEALWPVCFSGGSEFDINAFDIHGMNIFVMLLIKIKRGELLEKNVDAYKNIRSFFLKKQPEILNTALEWSIAHQNFPIFKFVIALAIWNDVAIEDSLFDGGLLPEMAAVISYRSARQGQTIRQRLQEYAELPIQSLAQKIARRAKQEKLKQIYYDCEDTSDEEASDDEDDSVQMVDPTQRAKLIAPGTSQLVRGSHFCPNRFTRHEARRAAREAAYHQQTIYSQATYNLAQRNQVGGGGQIGFAEADRLVQAYFSMLKLTPDKAEAYRGHEHKRSQNFSSLYLRLIHVYVNKYGYDALFNKGEIRYNFNFLSEDNPTLSTTPDFLVAYKYCSGDRIVGNQRIYPKLWRTEGILKHRRVGYVQVYLVDAAYLREHGADIDALNKTKEISISHNYSFNKEIIIESSIPAEYVFAYQVFSLPSFAEDWVDQIYQQYGLSKPRYDAYKRQLQKTEQPDYKKVLQPIIEEITTYQAAKFQEKIAQWKAEAQAVVGVVP